MFEKFLSQNVESFAQRYQGTYGFYRDANRKRLLVKLTEISGVRCDFIDANGISFHVRPDASADVGFEFLPPRSRWYNTAKGAMYTERVAQRQFSRGITGKNINMYLLETLISPVRVDFPNLAAVFEASEDTKSFLGHLDKGLSFALSPQFALDAKSSLIWVYREHVGKFTKKGNHFTMKLNEPTLWKTEITDALQEIGCTAEIA